MKLNPRDPKLTLSKLQLPPAELERLVRIAQCSLQLAVHDLRGPVGAISAILAVLDDQIRPALQDPGSSLTPGILDDLCRAGAVLRQINRIVASVAPYNDDEHVLRGFITKPSDLVEDLRNYHRDAIILASECSDTSLEFVFPENIMVGILSELVHNAIKYSAQTRTTVLLSWAKTAGGLRWTVENDGADPPITTEQRFVPLAVLLDTVPESKRHQQRGLRLIDRVVNVARGQLLFAQSKRLGGLLVLIELPTACVSQPT